MVAAEITRLDEATVQIRQPKASHWEAPFVFLLFGNDRALLLDTGATHDEAIFPLRGTVDGLIGEWVASRPNPDFELVVAHTHAHGDHVAGDPLFAGRPRTSVVGVTLDDVRAYFGLAAGRTSWCPSTSAAIEMSRTPGVPYPPGTLDQPDETPLAMPPSILDEVRDALDVQGERVVRDRFVVVRQPGQSET